MGEAGSVAGTASNPLLNKDSFNLWSIIDCTFTTYGGGSSFVSSPPRLKLPNCMPTFSIPVLKETGMVTG